MQTPLLMEKQQTEQEFQFNRDTIRNYVLTSITSAKECSSLGPHNKALVYYSSNQSSSLCP